MTTGPMCGAVDPDTGAVCDVESGHITHRAFTEDGGVVTWERDPEEYESPEVEDDEFTEMARRVARAKRDDPETSHEAAARVGDMRPQMRVVLDIFQTLGPAMTDDELHDRVCQLLDDPDIPWSSYRSARKGLVEQGFIVDSGERGTSKRGNPAIIWELTSS